MFGPTRLCQTLHAKFSDIPSQNSQCIVPPWAKIAYIASALRRCGPCRLRWKGRKGFTLANQAALAPDPGLVRGQFIKYPEGCKPYRS
jgi:hypothetical protein